MEIVNTISIPIDPALKQNAEGIFRALGITPAQAIALFYKQVELHHGLPFQLTLPQPLSSTMLDPSTLNGNPHGNQVSNGVAAHTDEPESSTVIVDEIELYQSPDQDAMLKEEAVFREMQTQLQEQYPDQYVAIHQGEVVDHDTNNVELIRRRKQNYKDKVVLLRHVDSDPDRVITL